MSPASAHHQCCLSVPPISARQCCLPVAHKRRLSVPISAAYQCPSLQSH
ncbi:unnamed protein product [Staurois parvus]|uniref:Uncharacterized protein n=1 Tax=Staurois parvus TaxID=386267 RepID=A0ABN9BQ56_9NEOB|nr:unnamed protein product [Staurois parvus]